MVELGTQMAALVLTRATLEQLLELGIPALLVAVKRILMWLQARNAGDSDSNLLRQRLLRRKSNEEKDDMDDLEESKLDDYENTVEDYGEVVVQFGFIVLFGLTYPPATLVCLLNNLIEVRSDLFKTLFLMKRVPSDQAADIGIWTDMLRLIRSFAIWTNAGLLAFTSNRSTKSASDIQLRTVILFFVLNRCFLWLKDGIEYAVSGTCISSFLAISSLSVLTLLFVISVSCLDFADVPGRTLREQARQEYLAYRCFGAGERPQYKQNMTAQLERRAKQFEKENRDFLQVNSDLVSVWESGKHQYTKDAAQIDSDY